jgi:hypothetical protein
MVFDGGAFSPTIERTVMKAQLKNAAITTAIVLATIFALRQVAVTRGLVDKALQG